MTTVSQFTVDGEDPALHVTLRDERGVRCTYYAREVANRLNRMHDAENALQYTPLLRRAAVALTLGVGLTVGWLARRLL
jgi:hypothetical protein